MEPGSTIHSRKMLSLSGISTGQHLALISASYVQQHRNSSHKNMTTLAPLHGGVNILLGGVMMSSMLLVVFCICYCCHKRIQKTEFPSDSSQNFLQLEDSDSTLQVFTLDGQQQCYESEGLFFEDEEIPPSPPPSYSTVMAGKYEEEIKDPDLPSYESALQLSCQGYV